jgi:hypothetical protein
MEPSEQLQNALVFVLNYSNKPSKRYLPHYMCLFCYVVVRRILKVSCFLFNFIRFILNLRVLVCNNLYERCSPFGSLPCLSAEPA